MRLFRYRQAPIVQHEGRWFALNGPWDAVVNRDDLHEWLGELLEGQTAMTSPPPESDRLAPIGTQEVWAAGVTYLRSRDARDGGVEAAAAATFYDRVYDADRPELFFKATPHRGRRRRAQPVRIRRDSQWNVPEPELALVINAAGARSSATRSATT